jgi:protein SCO1/2
MRRLWAALLAVILLALVMLGALLVVTQFGAHTYSGQVLEPAPPAGDFELTDETDQPFALSVLRGQWILLTYGYTTCPDVCPMTLANLKQVKAQLGPQAAQLHVVFVSVDPERDTPEVMHNYLHHFDNDFKGLTGTPESVARAAQAFGVKYEKHATNSALGYLVSHTAYVYLLDPQFRWRITFPFGVRPDEIANDVKYLMGQAVESE